MALSIGENNIFIYFSDFAEKTIVDTGCKLCYHSKKNVLQKAMQMEKV